MTQARSEAPLSFSRKRPPPQGEVEVRLPNGKVVAILGEGDVIGEVAFYNNGTRTADVTAKTWCGILPWHRIVSSPALKLVDGSPPGVNWPPRAGVTLPRLSAATTTWWPANIHCKPNAYNRWPTLASPRMSFGCRCQSATCVWDCHRSFWMPWLPNFAQRNGHAVKLSFRECLCRATEGAARN